MKKIIDARTFELAQTLSSQSKVRDCLAKLKEHHRDSYDHSIRVGIYCTQLGKINKLDRGDLHTLILAGLLHDLGKCDISLSVLDKDGKLNKLERKIIDQHSRLAFIKLADADFSEVRKVVIAHHEQKINAYPRSGKDRRAKVRSLRERRQADAKIKELSEILAAADFYDALKEPRSYKPPMSLSEIKDIMLNEYIGDREYVRQVLGLKIPPGFEIV